MTPREIAAALRSRQSPDRAGVTGAGAMSRSDLDALLRRFPDLTRSTEEAPA